MANRIYPEQPKQINPKILGLIMAGLILILMISQGAYTIRSGKVGVLASFGKYSDTVKMPGLHFKIPILQDVSILDIKMQTAHYQEDSLKDAEGVIYKPRIIVLDSKNLNIGMDLTVQFTPDYVRAREILALYGQNYFEKLINPIVRDVTRDVVSQYQAEEIAFKRSLISAELYNQLNDKFKDLPFVLRDMQIRTIELPKIVRTKIEEVQLAKQEEQRLSMIEKQAQKNQSIKTIQANTKLIEVTTQARAEAARRTIEAEAIANANIIIAESLSAEFLKYETIKQWNGAYPKTVAGESSSLLLQIE